MNRFIEEAEYLANKINNLSQLAFLIKLADREHNVSDLHLARREFRLRYARETLYILNHLTREIKNSEYILLNSIWETIKPILHAEQEDIAIPVIISEYLLL